MAGPGVGTARIVVDTGDGMPRFVARVSTGKKAATVATLLGALPALTAELEQQLRLAAAREAGTE